jgi:hypothetical protein
MLETVGRGCTQMDADRVASGSVFFRVDLRL